MTLSWLQEALVGLILVIAAIAAWRHLVPRRRTSAHGGQCTQCHGCRQCDSPRSAAASETASAAATSPSSAP